MMSSCDVFAVAEDAVSCIFTGVTGEATTAAATLFYCKLVDCLTENGNLLYAIMIFAYDSTVSYYYYWLSFLSTAAISYSEISSYAVVVTTSS